MRYFHLMGLKALLVVGFGVGCGSGTSPAIDASPDDAAAADAAPDAGSNFVPMITFLFEERSSPAGFGDNGVFGLAYPFDLGLGTGVGCNREILAQVGDCTSSRPRGILCPAGCPTLDEGCTFDDTCSPACETPCPTCGADESCLNTLGQTNVCIPFSYRSTLGDVTVTGTTSPISLMPPFYNASPAEQLLAAGPITIAGLGADIAGFRQFELMAEPPTAVELVTPLTSLTMASFEADLPLSWTANGDSMEVTVRSRSSALDVLVICETDDDGDLTIPVAMFEQFPPNLTQVDVALRRVREVTTGRLEGFGEFDGHPIPTSADSQMRFRRSISHPVRPLPSRSGSAGM